MSEQHKQAGTLGGMARAKALSARERARIAALGGRTAAANMTPEQKHELGQRLLESRRNKARAIITGADTEREEQR